MRYFLGIDTSNYTTSVSLADESGKIVLNSKKLLPVAGGERGLRQSDALFAHTKAIPELIGSVSGREIAAVGVSAFPRDAAGSYMPCFLAGVSAAASASAVLDVPLFRFSHQRGHIRAALYSAGREDLIAERFAAFHVSGGTTEVLLCEKDNIALIGGTLDLNAGQAIDRAGVLMGLAFPCGRELSAIAEKGVLPEKPKISVSGLDCNFSGLENKVTGMLQKGISREDVSLYVIEFVYSTLERLCGELRRRYPDIPIVCAGGVCSNRLIASRLTAEYGASFALPEFSSDNAAGIALLALDRYKKEVRLG